MENVRRDEKFEPQQQVRAEALPQARGMVGPAVREIPAFGPNVADQRLQRASDDGEDAEQADEKSDPVEQLEAHNSLARRN